MGQGRSVFVVFLSLRRKKMPDSPASASPPVVAKRFRFERSDWKEPAASLRHVDLTLRIYDDRIDGSEDLFFKAQQSMSVLTLDAQALEIHEVSFADAEAGGNDLRFAPCSVLIDKHANRLSVALPCEIPAGGRFCIRVSATSHPTQNILDGAYFDTTPPGAPPQIISQCQQWGFQRIMPIVDDCTAKCTWRTVLEGSRRYTHLISNGDIDRSACPDGHPVPVPGDPSRVRMVYRNDIPMPPYLFIVAAGTWDCLQDSVQLPSGRVVRLEYLVPPHSTAGARLPMEILKKAAVFQAKYTGCEYERECYRTICMEKSNFGGMENVGNTTIITEAALLDEWTGDKRLFYAHGVIVHEFEHNHCGSDVTMKTPFDMWLNEAYTVTVERAFARTCFGDAICRIDELSGLNDRLRGPLAAEAAGASFPIVRDGFDSPDDVVDGVTYDKAPEVLGMLRLILGDTVYEHSLADYFARHKGGNVETADFIAAFPQSPLLDRFFHEWLFTTGYPRISCIWSYDRKAKALHIDLTQTRICSGAEPSSNPFVVPLKIHGVSSDGTIIPETGKILILDEKNRSWTLENVSSAPAFLDFGSSEPFYGVVVDESATAESLALTAKVSPFPVGRLQAVRALASRASAGSQAARAAFAEAVEAAFCNRNLDSAVRAAVLCIAEDDLTPESTASGPARAVAARELRREAAKTICFDRLAHEIETIAGGDEDDPAEGIRIRALRRSLLNLAVLTGDARAEELVERVFNGAKRVEDRFGAVRAALDAGLALKKRLLAELMTLCSGHVGAFSAFLSLLGSDPVAEDLFDAVAAVESNPAFKPEHPGHSRSLYAAVSRNAEALWTPRGQAWFAEKLPKMAAVNENVAIVMLGALQEWRNMPEQLKSQAEKLLKTLNTAVKTAAPEAFSLSSRIQSLLS